MKQLCRLGKAAVFIVFFYVFKNLQYGAGKTMDETFGLIETVEKAAQIYMLTAHLPRVNTIKDEEMLELAEFFGVKYRKDFLNI